MFAFIAFVLLLLVAFGVAPEGLSLLYLGLAFWTLHFAVPIILWSYKRRGNQQ